MAGGFAGDFCECVDVLSGVFGFKSRDDDFECGGEDVGGFGDWDRDAMDAGFHRAEAVLELSGLSGVGGESVWEGDGLSIGVSDGDGDFFGIEGLEGGVVELGADGDGLAGGGFGSIEEQLSADGAAAAAALAGFADEAGPESLVSLRRDGSEAPGFGGTEKDAAAAAVELADKEWRSTQFGAGSGIVMFKEYNSAVTESAEGEGAVDAAKFLPEFDIGIALGVGDFEEFGGLAFGGGNEGPCFVGPLGGQETGCDAGEQHGIEDADVAGCFGFFGEFWCEDVSGDDDESAGVFRDPAVEVGLLFGGESGPIGVEGDDDVVFEELGFGGGEFGEQFAGFLGNHAGIFVGD